MGDAGPGLGVALEGAGKHRIKLHPFAGKILSQANALAVPEFAQVVVVFGAKRSLAVAYKIESAHALSLSDGGCCNLYLR